MCWLLDTSVPQKSAYDDTIRSFSSPLMHQTDDDLITWMIVSCQILAQIYLVAKTGEATEDKNVSTS